MNTFKRYLEPQTLKDLDRKMVFICGPRQVGKTTLSKVFLQKNSEAYLNWDIPIHREKILKRELPDSPIWIFDEIHKYENWRNYLKGIYDQFGDTKQILVTGSAKLDVYRRGGDSLQGRYHFLRLFPLSVAELGISKQADFLELLKLGGFPEPFFSSSEVEAKRWSIEYRTRMLEEDVVSLERINNLGTLELLLINLPNYVGSPLSLNSLREELQVAHKTVAHWLEVFERLYAIFRLSPFASKELRAVKKEQKHYHFDWTLIDDESLRFENMVAVHLLKWCYFENDTKGRELSLKYFRDIDKREVDFVIVEKTKPILFIECKWNDGDISKALRYINKKFPEAEHYQISAVGTKDYISGEGIRVCPACKFLETLV